ncbi:MAG: GYD domain-containing protein [Anaerolineae bacterium]|nr:MAG: GYD domain-containing protein [Anaerolineae bacterium]
MPTYVMLMNLTEQGIRNIKEASARIETTEKAIEAAGGKLRSRLQRE